VISSSTTALNFSSGCAPTRRRPLMKKCGVPLAWSSSARSWSAVITALYFFSAIAVFTLSTSRASSLA